MKLKIGRTPTETKADVSASLFDTDDSNTAADLVPLRLVPNAEAAPIVNFAGPLTMGTYREHVELVAGEEGEFHSLVGTAGVGVGAFTAIVNKGIPLDAFPEAEFTFPHRDPGQPPIVVTSILETRC